MKKLVFVGMLGIGLLTVCMENRNVNNVLMVTFSDKATIAQKLNPTSLYILEKINIFPSIENKTLSHIQVQTIVKEAHGMYNKQKDRVYIYEPLINMTIMDLINSGNKAAASQQSENNAAISKL